MASVGTNLAPSAVTSVAGAQTAAPASAGAVVGRIADQSLGKPGGAGRVLVGDSPGADFVGKTAEDAVAGNPDHKQVVDFNTLNDPVKRTDFVKNITQLDGVRGGPDETSCGPSALLAGLTMANPKATQKLASGILSQSPSERKEMFGQNSLTDTDKATLKRIGDGKASPADIQQMSQIMAEMKGASTDKTSVDQMAIMLSNTKKLVGDDMPNMELHMFGDSKKVGVGHWQAYANGMEIDPWPGTDGKSTLTQGAAGLAQGASHYENGAVHSKIIVEDHGNSLTIPRYLAEDSHGQRVAHDDPNVPLTTYHYKQDLIGYGYHRTSGDVPERAAAQKEPNPNLGPS